MKAIATKIVRSQVGQCAAIVRGFVGKSTAVRVHVRKTSVVIERAPGVSFREFGQMKNFLRMSLSGTKFAFNAVRTDSSWK